VSYKHELPEGFLHLSLQEYLAAWHISELPMAKQQFYFEWELCMPRIFRGVTLFKKAVVVIFSLQVSQDSEMQFGKNIVYSNSEMKKLE